MMRPSWLLLAVGFSLSHASAQDTWENRSGLLSGASSPRASAYNGDRFLLFSSSSTYWYSAAGTGGYSFSSLPSPPSFYTSNGAASGGDRVVVTGTNNTSYFTTTASIAGAPSTPISWTKVNPLSRSVDLYRVRYLNDRFIAGVRSYVDSTDYNNNSYTEIVTSTDGQNWTSHQFIANTVGNLAFDTRDFAFKPGATAGTGSWVIGTNGNYVLTAPENLGSLTAVNLSTFSIGTSPSLAYGAGRFVLGTGNGKILTSTTGAAGSWSLATLPVTLTSIGEIHFNGTSFVAVGATNPSNTSAILLSTNGTTWTSPSTQPSLASNALNFVNYADGLWLAGSNARNLHTHGASSVILPAFTQHPSLTSAATGDSATLTVTATGTPAPTLEWLKNGTPLTDGAQSSGSTVSGATTASLTISNLSFADAASYSVRATNIGAAVTSTAANLSVYASSQGAILTPYQVSSTLGGTILPGTNPPVTIPGNNNLSSFSASQGLTYLPNTSANSKNYTTLGGTNPSGTKIVLGVLNAPDPLAIYEFATQSITVLPAPPIPLGPIASLQYNYPVDLAENGDVVGIFQTPFPDNKTYGYRFIAATQTYELLGNVPNPANDIATTPGGISADGQSISGYERVGAFNGAFLWTAANGFTLLPTPANGSLADGDVREISPNGRFIVGFGTAHPAFGSGQTAFRWDRSASLDSLTGFALPKRDGDTFADARTVNDDGTVGGNVRQGSLFNANRAAVWLPSGALVVLPDYLAAHYNLNLGGFILNQVTSISADRRVIAGTATNASNASEGFLLTLPDPIDLAPVPDIAVRAQGANRLSGSTVGFAAKEIGSPGFSQNFTYVSNAGSATLTSLDITITGTHAADFSIYLPSGSQPSELGINQYFQLNLLFSPQPGDPGLRTATLSIASNDPDEAPFTLNLSGTATAPTTTPQTITFAPLDDVILGSAPISLSATSTSGLPVSFTIQSGPARLEGNTLVTTNVGTVTVRASQSGNSAYAPAPPVDRTFNVTAAAFATWHLLDSLPLDQRDPEDDPDNDGITNLVEFALASHPGQFTAGPSYRTETIEGSGVHPSIRFTRRKALTGAAIVVEASSSLSFSPLFETTVVSVTDHDDGTETVIVRSNHPVTSYPVQFLRLRVE